MSRRHSGAGSGRVPADAFLGRGRGTRKKEESIGEIVSAVFQAVVLLLPMLAGGLVMEELMNRFLPTQNDYRQRYSTEDTENAVAKEQHMDPYKVLGADEGEELTVVKKKYRKLALIYHPDRQCGKSAQECSEAEAKMREINMAYRRIQLQHGQVDEGVTDPEKKTVPEPADPPDAGGHKRQRRGKKGRHDHSDGMNDKTKEQKEFHERCREELKRLDAELAAAKRRSKSAVQAPASRSGKKAKTKDHKGVYSGDKHVTPDHHVSQYNSVVADDNGEKRSQGEGEQASDAADASGKGTAERSPPSESRRPDSSDNGGNSDTKSSKTAVSAYDQSLHPLAVAIRMGLICAFWGLLRPEDAFDDHHGACSLADHLDEDNNNVLHYCVHYGRPDIGSSVISNASYQWSALVFEQNRLGQRPSEVPMSQGCDTGNSSRTAESEHRRIVDELKRLEAGEEEYRAAQRDRRFDWYSAAVALCEVAGVGVCLRLIAAFCEVHIVGPYEACLVALWRVAPGVHSLNVGNMGTSVVCLVCGLRLFMYFSWFGLIFGGLMCGTGAFGLYCCFPFAANLLLALALLLYNLVALCVGIVALPAVGVGRLLEKSVVPKYEMVWGEENRKKVQLILKQAQKGFVFCMSWFVACLICVLFRKVFGMFWG